MKGFSIIELVIVVVVVAIAGAAIGSAYAYLSRSLALNSAASSQLTNTILATAPRRISNKCGRRPKRL